MENKEIVDYTQLEINTVVKVSDGSDFISVGSFEYLSVINSKFHFYYLTKEISNRLKVEIHEIELLNIQFRDRVFFDFKKDFDFPSLRFGRCNFLISPTFTDKTFKNKIEFRLCHFRSLRVTNATFKEYIEFFDCIFFEKVIFSNCFFENNAVFTKSTFHGNCLLTNSTFEKLGIFSRAKFHDENKNPTALDLSQAIINGQLIFFETVLGNYKAFKIDSDSKKFDKTINEGDVIPMQNKRETFRIIKHQLLQQNNVIEAEKYAKLEKQTFRHEMYKGFKIKNTSNLLLLSLNKISNNYKTNWLFGLGFVLVFISLFHFLLVLSEQNYCNTVEYSFKLFNPTDFSLFGSFECDWNYVILFFGKIVIGYGIYQTIQAFRKYK